jgi:multiple sugar transport system permease protein
MDQQKKYTPIREHQQTSKQVMKVVRYTFLGFWALLVLFPFYWMVLTSIKSYGDYNAEFVPKFITLAPTLENYLSAFTQVPLADYFVNTIIFTVVTTAIILLVTMLAAFALARLEFRGKNLAFTLL